MRSIIGIIIKIIIKLVLLIVIIFSAFVIGVLLGNYFGPHSELVDYFHYEIERHFGTVTRDDEVIGRIPLISGVPFQNRSFLIIIEDGVKTIRVRRSGRHTEP